MSCKEISADWAAQRIKGLSLGSAIKNALLPRRQPKDSSKVIKTLINCFKYPRKGPGMMWEACAAKTKAMGGQIEMGSKVTGCFFDEETETWQLRYQNQHGDVQSIEADHVISSAPLRELARGLTP